MTALDMELRSTCSDVLHRAQRRAFIGASLHLDTVEIRTADRGALESCVRKSAQTLYFCRHMTTLALRTRTHECLGAMRRDRIAGATRELARSWNRDANERREWIESAQERRRSRVSAERNPGDREPRVKAEAARGA